MPTKTLHQATEALEEHLLAVGNPDLRQVLRVMVEQREKQHEQNQEKLDDIASKLDSAFVNGDAEGAPPLPPGRGRPG